MYILEATPIISDGPAWTIAIGSICGMLIALFKSWFPILGQKYNYDECKKDCATLKLAFDEYKKKSDIEKKELEQAFELFRKKSEESHAAKLQELNTVKKEWRKTDTRLTRAEVFMRTLKVALNKKGYDDFMHLLEEIISEDNGD